MDWSFLHMVVSGQIRMCIEAAGGGFLSQCAHWESP